MSEHQEQAALFHWARTQEAEIPELQMLYAVPNGGHRHKAVAAKLKAEGVKPGVLDVNLDVARGVYNGLRIEMKYGANQPSPNQREWMNRYYEQGFLPIVCWSWVDASTAILAYLALEAGQDWGI